MRMDKLTSRFQQALADAQSLAVGRDNNMLEPAHVMAALLSQQGGSTAPLLAQAQVNVPALQQRINDMLARLPQVRGQEGNINVGNDLTRLLNLTDKLAQQRGDQFIASELFVLAALDDRGELGAALLAPGSGVLTHCNTGSLATAGFGTALGVIRAGVAAGRIDRVYADETRPWLQGARLTMWELMRDGIPAQLIADSAAAHLMKSGAVQWVIVGADRIAANGDTANKIGTYQLSVTAKYHGVKFMVVAPASTVDMATGSGEEIDIELRDPAELLGMAGVRTVVAGAQAWNPVFDVAPAELIDVIVTERGVIEHPNSISMQAMFGR